jgi:hypothetical protein
MRRKLLASCCLVVATWVVAVPATAHPGHGSCLQNAEVAIVPLAQAVVAGETASGLAHAGTLPDDIAASHDALCQPRA